MKNGKPPRPCTVCFGAKRLKKKQLRRSKPKPHRENDIGPAFANAEIDINPDVEELSQLLGKWKILQSLKGGHRWSTDDLVTAWVAYESLANPENVRNHLDLGCGIGTVLLMCAWKLHANAECLGVGVEAQSASAHKARRNLIMNGLDSRRRIVECDFREFESEERFDLITGTPPYFPVTQREDGAHPEYGALPTFEQSAPARFEFRGGLEVYIATAARMLAENGVLVVCEGNLSVHDLGMRRVLDSAQANALHVTKSVFVHGREDKPALFAVHVLGRQDVVQTVRERFVVRHVGGERTQQSVGEVYPQPRSVGERYPRLTVFWKLLFQRALSQLDLLLLQRSGITLGDLSVHDPNQTQQHHSQRHCCPVMILMDPQIGALRMLGSKPGGAKPYRVHCSPLHGRGGDGRARNWRLLPHQQSIVGQAEDLHSAHVSPQRLLAFSAFARALGGHV
ncbi:hypothetical protein BASA81_008522 [Batrachochytrium salamandrivorans]|nr:hypothetical protein BASA81_008522 [Batrachochytrium salamandrivorans]